MLQGGKRWREPIIQDTRVPIRLKVLRLLKVRVGLLHGRHWLPWPGAPYPFRSYMMGASLLLLVGFFVCY